MSISDTLPQDSQLHAYARHQDFLDCYSVEFDNEWACSSATMPELAALCLSVDVPGANTLVRVRDKVVKPFGLKGTDDLEASAPNVPPRDTKVGDRIGFFQIYAIDDHEIILGENDVHQDFRVSIYREPTMPGKLFAATCCQRHNLFGYAYLAAILPFHKLIVKGMLDGFAKKLSAAGDAPVAVS